MAAGNNITVTNNRFAFIYSKPTFGGSFNPAYGASTVSGNAADDTLKPENSCPLNCEISP